MFTAPNGEIAWPLEEAVDAVRWIAQTGLAVLGGEAWLVGDDGVRTGLIPLQNSDTLAVRGWSAEERAPAETWANYVDRCLRHALNALRAESKGVGTEVKPNLRPYLRYNVTFASEAG